MNEMYYLTKYLPNHNHHDHVNAGGNDGRVYWLPSSARRLTIIIVTELLSQLNTHSHNISSL
jgi:hypothetical protein